jgi:hypothetical protein
VRGLEGLDRPPRLAPEHAVGADAERALDRDRSRGRELGPDAPSSPAASHERAARDRPDDPVDLEPVRGLEGRDRPFGLVPEDAVGGDPSARCMAATSGPRLPSLSMPAEASVTSVPCARAASWAAGPSTVAVINAAETSAALLAIRGVRRSAAYSRRRWERASERSHSSVLPRSRRPGGCDRMAHPS